MATCKKCKCEKKYCGCADKAIPVAAPCSQDTLSCPSPELCPETFSAGCVVYTGNSIIDLGINQGDRMDVILQRITLWLTNPACIDGTGDCMSPLGLRSTYISQTIAKIAWNASDNSAGYVVEYKLASDVSWSVYPSISPSISPEFTITGLASGEEYYIRVRSDCTPVPPNSGQSCYSVTISVIMLD